MLKKYWKEIYQSNIFCFDFDGTIACSNSIKIDSFKESAEKNLKKQDEIESFMRIVKENFGKMNRVEMCEEFVNRLEDKNENLPRLLCRGYEESLGRKYSSSRLVPGFKDFLSSISHKEKIIVTAGNKKEIIEFLEANNIGDSFSDILDCSKKKSDHYEEIFKKIGNKKACVFGDTYEDYKSSKSLNRHFFLVSFESRVLNNIHVKKIREMRDERVFIIQDYK